MNAEQVARNDAVYREANERIRSAAVECGVNGQVPFICECADPECRAILLLTLPEYEEIRVVEKIGRAAEIVEELDPRQTQHG